MDDTSPPLPPDALAILQTLPQELLDVAPVRERIDVALKQREAATQSANQSSDRSAIDNRRAPLATSSRPWIAAIAICCTLFIGAFAALVSHHQTAPATTYRTAAGQCETVILRDGTRVTLAPQTTLTVASQFGTDNRLVTLQGRAFFDVEHHTGRVFTVKTDNITTQVLGTQFDIQHFADDSDVKIAVKTGKVAARWPSAQRGVTLTPGMLGHITDSSATVTTLGDVSNYTDWTTGNLNFQNVAVTELLSTVGHWYGYEFRLTDSTLASRHVTTTLDGRTPSGVLRAITLLLDVRMTFESQPTGVTRVILVPARSGSSTAPQRYDGSHSLSPRMEYGR